MARIRFLIIIKSFIYNSHINKHMNKKTRTIITPLIVIALFTIIFVSNMPATITGMVVQDVSTVDNILNDLDGFREQYNEGIEEVPAFVKSMLGDEKIELTIERSDGTQVTLSIEAQDGELKQLTTEKFEEYTLEMQTDEDTINNINNAENQITALEQAMNDKDIQYKAKGFKTSIKTWFYGAVLTVVSWFQ